MERASTTPCIIPLVAFVTLVRNKFLDEIARATSVINSTHSTTCVKRTIFMFLLFIRQGRCTENIVETVEDNVVIETWVTILIRMRWVPTWCRVQYIFTVLYKIDRLSIGHSVLVDEVGCRVVDDIVMSHEAGNLRTKDLCTVPVRSISVRRQATENGLRGARLFPILLVCIENIWVTRRCSFVTLMVVDI